jgi:Leu/Phe-tRNA-protein transferase
MDFPVPSQADADRLLAYGRDLYPQRLLAAYAQGIFPWPCGEDWPILWYSPHPRMVLVLRYSLRAGDLGLRHSATPGASGHVDYI